MHSHRFCAAWGLERWWGQNLKRPLRPDGCDATEFLLQFVFSLWMYRYNKQMVSPKQPLSVASFRSAEWGEWRLCSDPDRDPDTPWPVKPGALPGPHQACGARPLPLTGASPRFPFPS